MQRSIAGQVEHWARLGRAIDSILNAALAMAASRRGAAHSLSDVLAEVETPSGGNGWPITVRACHSLTTYRTLINWDC